MALQRHVEDGRHGALRVRSGHMWPWTQGWGVNQRGQSRRRPMVRVAASARGALKRTERPDRAQQGKQGPAQAQARKHGAQSRSLPSEPSGANWNRRSSGVMAASLSASLRV
eukprot:1766211-Alexandrium_andersonii.AAC.1